MPPAHAIAPASLSPPNGAFEVTNGSHGEHRRGRKAGAPALAAVGWPSGQRGQAWPAPSPTRRPGHLSGRASNDAAAMPARSLIIRASIDSRHSSAAIVIQAPQSMSKTRRKRGPSEGMPSCSATPIEAVAAQRARRFEADARTCKRRSPRTRMAASAVGRVQSPDRFAGLARLAGCCGAICNGRTRATQAIDFPSMAP